MTTLVTSRPQDDVWGTSGRADLDRLASGPSSPGRAPLDEEVAVGLAQLLAFGACRAGAGLDARSRKPLSAAAAELMMVNQGERAL